MSVLNRSIGSDIHITHLIDGAWGCWERGNRGAVVGVDQRLKTVCRLSKAAVIYILSRLSSCLFSSIVSDTNKKPDADVTAWRLEVEFEVLMFKKD